MASKLSPFARLAIDIVAFLVLAFIAEAKDAGLNLDQKARDASANPADKVADP